MKLVLTIQVKDSEDEETVEQYFKQIARVFSNIVMLASFAFDTLECDAKIT